MRQENPWTSILLDSTYLSFGTIRLENQVSAVLADIDEALKAASTSWEHLARLTVYLSRTQNLEVLKNLLRKANRLELTKTEFEFVDGFARDKGLLEAEATASIAG